MVCDVCRYRYGFIERIDEYLALFIIGWAVNVPLLISQALLSARDDHQMEEDRDSPRATEVATPILIILGFLTLVFTFGSLRYKTAFQVLLIMTFIRFLLLFLFNGIFA